MLKETPFLGWILGVAARGGWRAWHVPFPVRPIGGGRFVPEPRAKGLVDLFLSHHNPPRLYFAEVKGSTGRVTPEQQEFLDYVDGVTRALEAHFESVTAAALGVPRQQFVPPVRGFSWRPGDEAEIERVLLGKR